MVLLVARGWHFLVLCWPLLVSVVELCTSQGLLVWCQVLDLDLQFRMLPNVHLVLDFCASELPPNRLMKGWTQLGKNACLLLLMIERGSSHLRQQFPTGRFWCILLDNFMSYFLQFWRVWKALPFPTLTVLFHKFLPRWDLGLNVMVTTTIHEGTRSITSLGWLSTRTLLDTSTRHKGTWLPLWTEDWQGLLASEWSEMRVETSSDWRRPRWWSLVFKLVLKYSYLLGLNHSSNCK